MVSNEGYHLFLGLVHILINL